MKSQTKLIVSGFGGQGVLSLGMFVAYSAMNMGYATTWLPSYGPEMRGGTANCTVVIDPVQVASPLVTHPNFLCAFNAPSVAKFAPMVQAGGTMLVNSSVVTTADTAPYDVRIVPIPVDEMAASINPRGANIIMLGVLLALWQDIDVACADAAIEQVFAAKPQVIDVNKQCLRLGMDFLRA